MNCTLRGAIIGCGEVTNDYYLPMLLDWPGVQICVCCDVIAERAQHAASVMSAAATTDARDVGAGVNADFAIVATKEWQRAEVYDALDGFRGAIFLEKPVLATRGQFDVSAADAESAARLARRWSANNLVVDVNWNYRYMPAISGLSRFLCSEGARVHTMDVATSHFCWAHMLDAILYLCGIASVDGASISADARYAEGSTETGGRWRLQGNANATLAESLFRMECRGDWGAFTVSDVANHWTAIGEAVRIMSAGASGTCDHDRRGALAKSISRSFETFLELVRGTTPKASRFADAVQELRIDADIAAMAAVR